MKEKELIIELRIFQEATQGLGQHKKCKTFWLYIAWAPCFVYKLIFFYQSHLILLKIFNSRSEHSQSRGSAEFPNQNLMQIGQKDRSYDRRYKQTPKQILNYFIDD